MAEALPVWAGCESSEPNGVMDLPLNPKPAPLVFEVSIAYWSIAELIRRRSLRTFEACERLRARRKPGTAIAARSAMIATTIMISTSVKPARLVVSFLNIGKASFFYLLVRAESGQDFWVLFLTTHSLPPANR